MHNNKKPRKNNDLSIKIEKSSLAEFTKRPVPNKEELENFEEFVADEARDKEIDGELTEIYQDDNGDIVDVRKLEKIKKKGFFFVLLNILVFILIIGGGAYYLYENWYKGASIDATAVDFSIDGDIEVIAGEEYIYNINYKNNSRTFLENIKVAINLPENFIVSESIPEPGGDDGSWDLGDLDIGKDGKIIIKGIMIGPEDSSGIVSAYLNYSLKNYSSEYKNEAFLTTKIIDTGINFDFDYFKTVLVGEENELQIRFRAMENNYIDSFRISLEPQENVQALLYSPEEKKEDGAFADFQIDRPGVWQVSEVTDRELIVPIRFVLTDKENEEQSLVFRIENKASNGEFHLFYEKKLDFEVMKNNLNLGLIINASRDDQGVDFGETLNYSIIYNNKGETDMKDLVIMAILDSDFLDWTSLNDRYGGREKGNTITWSKEEIPELEIVKQDEEGVIDFSIKVVEFGAIDLKKEHVVKSYAQFRIGDSSEDVGESDNKSNTIENKINSDLSFKESVLYFNEDNIPVGTGPHPPKVGEKTTYKVYWQISNNLHELNKLGVSLKLPDYMSYEAKDRATVGTIVYSVEAHEIIWNIGRLPVSVYNASAEFSVGVVPSEEDRNKIMVLLPGSKVQAIDVETKGILQKMSAAQTTKLTDDEIGRGDGIVE